MTRGRRRTEDGGVDRKTVKEWRNRGGLAILYVLSSVQYSVQEIHPLKPYLI